ncbi:hypothetical protein HMPREF1199_00426 [Hoylesella oralis CC98A]|nr:hypothetical protein HMPREF1199_00426 [Hoylesella oralis CC98A]
MGMDSKSILKKSLFEHFISKLKYMLITLFQDAF